jgi:hypothetical protein
MASSFPWLATIASQFQEYTWKGIVFHYIPTSGNSVASTNTALGTVMMHTDYRVTAPAPTSKVELLNEYFACDARPSDSFVHPIECDPKENPYNVQYVRTTAVPEGEDPKSYDLGVVNIATQGFPGANTTSGEIWVTYEVELRKPQIVVGGSVGTSAAYSSADLNTTTTIGSNLTYSLNELGLQVYTKGFQFPVGTTGYYSVLATWYSGGTGTTALTGESFTNLGVVIPTGITTYPQTTPLTTVPLSGGQGSFVIQKYVYVLDPSKVSTIAWTFSNMTNVSKFNLVVTRVSPSFK